MSYGIKVAKPKQNVSIFAIKLNVLKTFSCQLNKG